MLANWFAGFVCMLCVWVVIAFLFVLTCNLFGYVCGGRFEVCLLCLLDCGLSLCFVGCSVDCCV